MLGRGPRRSRFLTVLAVATLSQLTMGTLAYAGNSTVLLLDASNSMNSAFGGIRRLDAAKQAISAAVPRYQTELETGLVVFGNRQRQSCRDIQTLVSPAIGNATQISAAAKNVKAQGVSMVAQGLQRAATEAGYRTKPASVIALVDGAGVDACLIDTCATAATLKKESRGLSIHVIAIAPKAPDVPLLECIASSTGGTYVAVSDERQMRNALDLALRASASEVKASVSASNAPPPKRKPRPLIHVTDAPAPPTKLDPNSPEPQISANLAALGGLITGGEPGAALSETENPVAVFAPTRPAGQENTPPTKPQMPAQIASAANETTMTPAGDNQVVMAPSGTAPSILMAPQNSMPAPAPPTDPAAQQSGTTVLYKRGGDDQVSQTQQQAAQNQAAQKPTAMAETPAQTPELAAAPAQPIAPQPAPAAPANSNGLKIVSAQDANNQVQQAAAPVVNLAQDVATAAGQAATSAVAAAMPDAPAAPAPAGDVGEGSVRLAAMIVEGSKPVPEGMMWQIFELAPDGDKGALAMRSSDPAPTLKLNAGPYMVEGRFGNAARSMPVVIEADKETQANLVLDVGGLQLVPAVAGTANVNADITNTIFAEGNTRTPVVANAASGAVIYLTAGRYRIVSQYGNANSIARDDIQIQRGKLTQAKINHRAAPITFRLVSDNGGTPLADALWVINDASGKAIKRSQEATPTYVLIEGTYQIAVSQGGKTFSKSVTVEQGVPATVEITAK